MRNKGHTREGSRSNKGKSESAEVHRGGVRIKFVKTKTKFCEQHAPGVRVRSMHALIQTRRNKHVVLVRGRGQSRFFPFRCEEASRSSSDSCMHTAESPFLHCLIPGLWTHTPGFSATSRGSLPLCRRLFPTRIHACLCLLIGFALWHPVGLGRIWGPHTKLACSGTLRSSIT